MRSRARRRREKSRTWPLLAQLQMTFCLLFIYICSEIVASTSASIDFASRRYVTCPFAEVNNNEFFCAVKDSSRTERIFRHSPQEFIPQIHDYDVVASLFENKTLLMIGDSLMKNQFVSLACILYLLHPDSVEQKFLGDISLHIPHTNTTIVFHADFLGFPALRNNLSAVFSAKLSFHPNTIESLRFADVLLLSFGHHFQNSKHNASCGSECGVDLNIFRLVIRRINAELTKFVRPSAAVYWRTVPPRHFFGGDWFIPGSRCVHTEPCLSQLAEAEFVAVDLSRIIRQEKNSNSRILDVLPLSLSRCDAHVGNLSVGMHGNISDCSHYCVPGVPDLWNTLFVRRLQSDAPTMPSNRSQHFP
jgi:hypothetical protein